MKILFVALMAVAAVSLAPRSSAALPPAEIYAKAEQWFDSLEKQGGEVPVDSVTNLADGYYNRCFQSDVCYGVRTDEAESFLYRKEGNGDWQRIGTMESVPVQPTPLKVELLGRVDGVLADDLAYQTEFVNHSALAGRMPLVVGKIAWNATNRNRIKRAFRRGLPVLLIQPSLQDQRRLDRLLGVGGQGAAVNGRLRRQLQPGTWFPDRPPEAYGVDRDNRSNLYEFSAMPPGETAQPVIVRESEGSSPAQMRIDEPRVPSDNEAFQAMRTDGLIEWLKEDTRRDSAASRATLAAARQEGELQRALQSQPDAIIKSLDQIRSFEHKLTTSQRGNTYTFRTQAWSVHSREHAKYIFFVKQTGDFSAKQAFFSDREQDRGRFAAHYNLENESMKWQESSDPVWNAKAKRVNEAVELPAGEHSPPTTLNAQQVSSSLNWQLTGTVGFSGPAPQGQIAGGVSITDSFTYNVNDVSVLNQSNSKAGAANAAWDFEIGEPNVSKGLCVSGITISNVPLVSRSTFSPTVEWIWRVDNSLRTIHSIYQRGFPFKVTFRTGLKHIYQTGLCGIERWSEDYEESHLIWLPWSS